MSNTAPAPSKSSPLLIMVERLAAVHNRGPATRSDITSSQNSAGDDGENRDGLNLPKE